MTTPNVVFRFNPAALEAVLNSSALEMALDHIGEDVTQYAKQIARIDTGAFRDSIEYEVVREGGHWVLHILSTDPGAVAIEARDRTLVLALEALAG